MKNSMKQTILMIICILIIFIPTYIAITYYCIKSSDEGKSKYDLEITDQSGAAVVYDIKSADDIAELILEMNSKLEPAGDVDTATLPGIFYDMSVTENGVRSSYRYYFSTASGERTLVMDKSGVLYFLDFNDVKSFLSSGCAYEFYSTAFIPTLSIGAGAQIFPTEAEWQYKAVDNTYVDAPVATVASATEYPMSGKNRLEFSVAPDSCSVSVYRGVELLTKGDSLSVIPYELLDSESLLIKISAEWTGLSGCRGSAQFTFNTSTSGTPEFYIAANTVLTDAPENTVYMGEFFTVVGVNISAPQKITFTSQPSLGAEPVFFTEGEYVYALIPIPNDQTAPLEYTFTLSYSGFETRFDVSARARDLKERDYDASGIGISRNAENVAEYERLLTEIGTKYESTRYFGSDKFIDYETYYENGVAVVTHGFGFKRFPNNGDEAFFLDGVDFFMAKDLEVRSIAAGKVVAVGSCKLLGNYIVVDHGFGLKTWYCNVSNSIATVGSTVQKGEVIGTSGKTGYSNENGVYLITTVADTPICPYSLQEKGMIFPQVNN